MTYSKKKKLDRRSSIMVAVRKELKAHNVYVSPESLKKLASALNPKYYYEIRVLRDIEEAAEALKLRYMANHTDMGSRGTEDTGTVIFGNVKFGSVCGDADNITEWDEGDFNMNEPFGTVIETRDWQLWGGHDDNYDDETASIVIYSPNRIYDEVEYTSKKDEELDRICQLRDAV